VAFAIPSRATLKGKQGIINHIALVLDMSGSMSSHASAMIKAVDSLTEHLAVRSLEMDQETRITVYTFDDIVEAVYYDKDVLRLPSIAKHYQPRGMTALVDATIKSQQDLAKTPELYGDHAFLTYVFTDGMENQSRNPYNVLVDVLRQQGDNWTVAAMVPNEAGQRKAVQLGFQAGNIAIWDATTAAGFEAAQTAIRTSADTFMTQRGQGVRSTTNLFSTGADAVNANTVRAAGLKPLDPNQYSIVPVGPSSHDSEIRDFVQSLNGGRYQIGRSFYELVKPEKIQGQKSLAVVEKRTGKVFVGDGVRRMINLPEYEVRVNPEANKEYAVYVQSTSTNRKLKVGQKVLILN